MSSFMDFIFGQGARTKTSPGGGLGEFFLGKGEEMRQIPRFTSQQEQVLNQLLGGVQQQIPQQLQFLQSILGQSPEAMGRFEAPALRQFEEEILPSIAERFTGQFGEGSQRSSAFGQVLGQAGAGLAENLQAQRSGLSFDALRNLQSLLGTGLTPQFEQAYSPPQKGFLSSLATGAGGVAGTALAGPLGGFLGSGLGSLFS